ncbi:MAG: type II toxin-antitoxin system death-on-curing family toxin [Chloroflexi bacterium]|nr:type II toxin-antitoxin system death-on-curing family toxin [Chloroflexota bacterium]MBU1748823.1 type II toxin-antitoxin system death-on-curing family toxin [Chloroflexota bacterium]
MTIYPTLNEALETYIRIMVQSGGLVGVLNMGALESALAQPRLTFSGQDLYPTLIEKAAALGFSLIQNHPFVDGNKRTGHAMMETFLVLNGYKVNATLDEQVSIVVQVASGKIGREEFTNWLCSHAGPNTSDYPVVETVYEP